MKNFFFHHLENTHNTHCGGKKKMKNVDNRNKCCAVQVIFFRVGGRKRFCGRLFRLSALQSAILQLIDRNTSYTCLIMQ
jgi:hypothetical protein